MSGIERGEGGHVRELCGGMAFSGIVSESELLTSAERGGRLRGVALRMRVGRVEREQGPAHPPRR
eukprot:6241-Pleurochrysis_carterae.AAC.1